MPHSSWFSGKAKEKEGTWVRPGQAPPKSNERPLLTVTEGPFEQGWRTPSNSDGGPLQTVMEAPLNSDGGPLRTVMEAPPNSDGGPSEP